MDTSILVDALSLTINSISNEDIKRGEEMLDKVTF
jgi:hypothetical protein